MNRRRAIAVLQRVVLTPPPTRLRESSAAAVPKQARCSFAPAFRRGPAESSCRNEALRFFTKSSGSAPVRPGRPGREVLGCPAPREQVALLGVASMRGEHLGLEPRFGPLEGGELDDPRAVPLCLRRHRGERLYPEQTVRAGDRLHERIVPPVAALLGRGERSL